MAERPVLVRVDAGLRVRVGCALMCSVDTAAGRVTASSDGAAASRVTVRLLVE